MNLDCNALAIDLSYPPASLFISRHSPSVLLHRTCLFILRISWRSLSLPPQLPSFLTALYPFSSVSFIFATTTPSCFHAHFTCLTNPILLPCVHFIGHRPTLSLPLSMSAKLLAPPDSLTNLPQQVDADSDEGDRDKSGEDANDDQ